MQTVDHLISDGYKYVNFLGRRLATIFSNTFDRKLGLEI